MPSSVTLELNNTAFSSMPACYLRDLACQCVGYVSMRQDTSAYVRIRQDTSAYVSIRQDTSACVRIRQNKSAYASHSADCPRAIFEILPVIV